MNDDNWFERILLKMVVFSATLFTSIFCLCQNDWILNLTNIVSGLCVLLYFATLVLVVHHVNFLATYTEFPINLKVVFNGLLNLFVAMGLMSVVSFASGGMLSFMFRQYGFPFFLVGIGAGMLHIVALTMFVWGYIYMVKISASVSGNHPASI